MNLISRLTHRAASRARRRQLPSTPRATRRALLVEPLESRVVLDISINFVGGTGPGGVIPPMEPDEVAGVVPEANWNNLAGAGSRPVGPLTDETGTPIDGTTIFFGGSNTWTMGIPDSPGDSRMMGGFLDSSATSLTIVQVSGLSAAFAGPYDVYIYFSGDNPGTGRFGFYTIGGTTLKGQDTIGFFDSFVEDTGSGGNYLRFAGVEGDVLAIFASAGNPDNPKENGFRAPINGFQIVAAGGAPGRGTPPPQQGLARVDQFLVDGLASVVPSARVAPGLFASPTTLGNAGSPLASLPAGAAGVETLLAAAGQDAQEAALLPQKPEARARIDDWFAGAFGDDALSV